MEAAPRCLMSVFTGKYLFVDSLGAGQSRCCGRAGIDPTWSQLASEGVLQAERCLCEEKKYAKMETLFHRGESRRFLEKKINQLASRRGTNLNSQYFLLQMVSASARSACPGVYL